MPESPEPLSFRDRMINALKRTIGDHYRLIFPSAIALPVQQKRIDILQGRIQTLAWVMTFGLPIWSILDSYAFADAQWRFMLIARLVGGAAFATFLLIGRMITRKGVRSLYWTFFQLSVVFLVPTFFYVFCPSLPTSASDVNPIAQAIANSYALAPLAILACVGLFPLALIESLCVVAPLLIVYALVNRLQANTTHISVLEMDWIAALLAIIATVTSYSQLRLVVKLVDYSAYDLLTDCLGRRSGEDVIRTLCHYAIRRKSHFALAFVDLDHFKTVNDRFGHQNGDKVLAEVAKAIRASIRKSDFVIRWGGEEFLIIMPDASIEDATRVLTKMASKGMGLHPDGKPQTVSVGVAERISDIADDAKMLIKTADKRLYQAKSEGRSRIVGISTTVLGFEGPVEP